MSLLDKFAHSHILVLGDLILDKYTFGDAERVSPEAPVVVLQVGCKEVRLGGAASVAFLARGLGARVTLAGVIGDDAEGRTLQSLLRDEQIDSQFVFIAPNRPTTTKERIIGRAANRHSHQIVRVDHEICEPIASKLEEKLIGSIHLTLLSRSSGGPATDSPFDAVLIADYAKGVCTTNLLRRAIDSALSYRIPVIVDPARIADYSRYAGATLLKPNRLEAERAGGVQIGSPSEALLAAEKLRRQCQVQSVLITLDRDGMALAIDPSLGGIPQRRLCPRQVRGPFFAPTFALTDSPAPDAGANEPGSTALFPAEAREVYDITGAGDMVLATLGLSLASNIPLNQAVQLANTAAGLEVERLGVASITFTELERAFARSTGAGRSIRGSAHRNQLSQAKIISPAEAISLAVACRAEGESIVFTNGCFDILHIGHVTCLQEAALLGDVLIVAINSDAGIRRLKGTGRPIISQQDRAAMVAALGCVDHVLIFDDLTPHQILQSIRPHVLVKGGTTTEIVGRELVEAYGGRVVRVGETSSVSTTDIISRVRNALLLEPVGIPVAALPETG